MKKKYSNKWIASRQTRKQRKYRANAPKHTRAKMLGANLSKELREKHKRRSISLRKGDSVKVMKGEFKKKIGKIFLVNLRKLKVSIEGLQKTKKDGTKINIIFDPSNLQIQELNLDDKKRIKSLVKENEIKLKSGDKKNAS